MGRTRIVLLIYLLVVALAWAVQVQAITIRSERIQNAATATGDGTEVDVKGYTTAVFHVFGTFDATINFEASIEGDTDFRPIECFSVADRTSSVTQVTAPGMHRCNIIGINKLRGRISAYTSGNVTVWVSYLSAGVT